MLKTDKALSKEEIAKSFVYTAIDKIKPRTSSWKVQSKLYVRVVSATKVYTLSEN